MAAGYWVVRTSTAGRAGEKVKYWMQGARPDKATRRERDALHADQARRDALLEEKAGILKELGGTAGVRLAELDQQLDELGSHTAFTVPLLGGMG